MAERPTLAAQLLRPIVQLRRGRVHHRSVDVPVLVPRHDELQHHQADYPSEFIERLGAGRPAVGQVRRGRDHRLHHAGLHQGHLGGAPALDDPGHAGGHRGVAGAVLVPVHVRGRRVGRGGVLRRVAYPLDPADQPVLDAGQRRLRSAAGQADLRLHRRRRQPGWRHRRRPHRVARGRRSGRTG